MSRLGQGAPPPAPLLWHPSRQQEERQGWLGCAATWPWPPVHASQLRGDEDILAPPIAKPLHLRLCPLCLRWNAKTEARRSLLQQVGVRLHFVEARHHLSYATPMGLPCLPARARLSGLWTLNCLGVPMLLPLLPLNFTGAAAARAHGGPLAGAAADLGCGHVCLVSGRAAAGWCRFDGWAHHGRMLEGWLFTWVTPGWLFTWVTPG